MSEDEEIQTPPASIEIGTLSAESQIIYTKYTD